MNLADEVPCRIGVIVNGQFDGFRVTLDGGKGRFQFVRDICNELATDFVDPMRFGVIAQHHEEAAVFFGGNSVDADFDWTDRFTDDHFDEQLLDSPHRRQRRPRLA